VVHRREIPNLVSLVVSRPSQSQRYQAFYDLFNISAAHTESRRADSERLQELTITGCELGENFGSTTVIRDHELSDKPVDHVVQLDRNGFPKVVALVRGHSLLSRRKRLR